MRSKPLVVIVCCFGLAALGCNISGGTVETAVAEVKADATQAAVVLTEAAKTIAAVGTEGASTLPVGGGPADTETGAITPTASVAPTVTQTVVPSPTSAPHLRVVYISGGNPWIVEPPAAPVQLSAVGSVYRVYLSDDGAKVVYARYPSLSAPAEIRAVNTDGSGDHTLLTPAQVGALEAPGGALYVDISTMEWIPNTHRMLLNTRGQFEGPGLSLYDDLFLLDADTGALTPLLAAGSVGNAVPSPDGTKMAIARATSVSLARIDASDMHPNVITFPAVLTYSEYAFYPAIVWAADSSRFGAIIPSPEPLGPSPSAAIWTVDASTGTPSLLATINNFRNGVLSPTLDRVGFIRPGADDSTDETYVSTLDESSSLHLATGSAGFYSFAPDGQHFAYFVGSSPQKVYVGSLGGGTVLVPGSLVRMGRWINNSQFVYILGPNASRTLQLGDVGGGSTLIATPTGDQTDYDAKD
jgi:hypothetical protein